MLVFSLCFVAAYFYHWFAISPLEHFEIVEPSISFEPLTFDEIMHQEVYAEEVQEADLIAAHIDNRTSLGLQKFHLPNADDVLHMSAILKLQATSDVTVKPKQDIKVENTVPSLSQDIRIAIVVDDMGASPGRTNQIIAIKAPLTSSFVTFASQLKKQTEKARKAGHELLIHVPMQPKSDIFVSDDVLTVDMSQEQISDNFAKMLEKIEGVVGVNNHMGSRFTEHGDKLEPVMKLLSKHHLFFLDSKTTSRSQGEKIAQKYHVPCVHRHVFLDNENNLEYILKQLEKTEKIAYKNGYAIAIGHPKTQTSRALAAWVETLPQKGIKLVHLSEIVAQEANRP